MVYKPDYGLRLLREGFSPTIDLYFFNFRLYSLNVLGPGQYSTMVEYLYANERHALSLDFNEGQLNQILAKATPELSAFIRSQLEADPTTPRAIRFEEEIPFDVRARLGQLQKAQHEEFVPLVAQEIVSGSKLARSTEAQAQSSTMSATTRVATPTPQTSPAHSAPPHTTVKALLDAIVAHLRTIPSQLLGDVSPLADAWEDIKEQIQDPEGLSPNCWPFYLMSIKGTIEGTVDELSGPALLTTSQELRAPAGNKGKIAEALLRRLLAKAKREKVRYAPFHFRYFRYSISGMCVYAQVFKRTGLNKCRIIAYSAAEPFGEEGEINTNIIESILTADEFEEARRLKWPVEKI